MTAEQQAHAPASHAPDRNLALELTRVTEAAAMAAARWVGRGDKNGADGAAVNAMRMLINSVSMRGVVVIGEGEKDNAPMLYNGENVGNGFPPERNDYRDASCRGRRRPWCSRDPPCRHAPYNSPSPRHGRRPARLAAPRSRMPRRPQA